MPQKNAEQAPGKPQRRAPLRRVETAHEGQRAAWVRCDDVAQEKKTSQRTLGPHGVTLGNVGNALGDRGET